MTQPVLKFPACERCRKSKIRCDSAAPKCSACAKSKTACILVDSTTGERYGRDTLHEMQQKLEDLEIKSRQHVYTSPQSEARHTSPSVTRNLHYVGDGSGLDMFQRVSSIVDAPEARAEVLEQLNVQSPRNEMTVPQNRLPSFELASQLVKRYFSHSHIHHPLLTKQSVYGTLDRVYSGGSMSSSREDLYRIFMISAISGVTMYRKGYITEHPYGFYRSAQHLLPYIETVGSMNAIQNLLLIARFAMYYHIECSIWDIVRICMRQCIELGLHLHPSSHLAAMDEQARRNLFWDCYVHDRYSSGILGRPFAISEHDIEVDLPVEASEEQILQSGCYRLDDISSDFLNLPNEASIFRFLVQLRRLTARIHIHFFSAKKLASSHSKTILSAGQVQRDLNNFLKELQLCRNGAPFIQQPQSLYERAEWHDFVVEKDKLTLIRGAIAHLPMKGMHPPLDLLVMCMNCATRVIELYVGLFASGNITWTRSYFQILFTSGLSIMFSISLLKSKSEYTASNTNLETALQALTACSELLSRFVSEMPDAGRFAVIFKSLSQRYTSTDQQNNLQVFTDLSQLRNDTGVNSHYRHAEDGGDGLGVATVDNATTHFIEDEIHNQFSPSAFQMDLEHFEDWSLYPIGGENLLGQMEVGLGEYAWGAQYDLNVLEQYFTT